MSEIWRIFRRQRSNPGTGTSRIWTSLTAASVSVESPHVDSKSSHEFESESSLNRVTITWVWVRVESQVQGIVTRVQGSSTPTLPITQKSSQKLHPTSESYDPTARVRFHKSLSPSSSHQCASPSRVTSPENSDLINPSLTAAISFFNFCISWYFIRMFRLL